MFKRFKSFSVLKKAGISVAALAIISVLGGVSQPQSAILNVQHSATGVLGAQTNTADPAQKKAPVVYTAPVTETQPIPFTTSTVSTSGLARGTSKITTVGVNGVSTRTYTVTYTDGQQTKKELLSQVTTTQPVTQVTSVGTYTAPPVATVPLYTPPPAATPICTNGTYVNSVGNTVCSPETSSTVPAGATAQCVDGTYSFSQSHSGTCSHHGGVSRWL
jgi:hypothetical protein